LSSELDGNRRLDPSKLPRHVAIIMDGNGRWAKKRLLNRVQGHERGAEVVRVITRACCELNIPVLTLYAFSTENWRRPRSEIQALMRLLKKFLVDEEKEMLRNGIRLGIIGQPKRLPADIQEIIEKVKLSTAHNTALLLNLALSYGGRTELAEMARTVAAKAAAGTIRVDDVDEKMIAEHLYTRGLPDPDLMIRTSGEMRLSNFLLWQLAYAEIVFTPTLWPDFGRDEFIDILVRYQCRERRFGGLSEADA
jgi:undecaprenyl diphosphate synthase